MSVRLTSAVLWALAALSLAWLGGVRGSSFIDLGLGQNDFSEGFGLDRRSALELRTRPHAQSSLSSGLQSLFAGKLPSITAAKGPCSSLATAAFVPVRKDSDFNKRLQYGPRKTVVMLIKNDIVLSNALYMNDSFSCTIFLKNNTAKKVQLFYKKTDAPLVTISKAHNILFIGVSLISPIDDSSPNCIYSLGTACPAIFILYSWNIQFTKATVLGWVHVARSVQCRLDSITVTAPKPPAGLGKPRNPSYLRDGLVMIQQTGAGVNRSITKAGNILSNSRISGAVILLSLTGCSVGNIIRNNYLSDYSFAAIRCGNMVSFMMDCHENRFSNNYIYVKPKSQNDSLGDTGAFYFSIKWFNPGNVVTCNYIYGGDYCYYLDFASTGITIDGGVCAYSRGVAVKMNTGKLNRIRNMIIIGNAPPQLMSCITTPWFNCTSELGTYYEDLRTRFYDLPSINKRYPYMKSLCSPSRSQVLDGTNCSPPGSPRVFCSGLPYGDKSEYIVLNRKSEFNVQGFCFDYPAVAKLNSIKLYNFTLGGAKFNARNDFGVKKASLIRKSVPKFTSCPRWKVGPRKTKNSGYYKAWNKPEPASYQLVQTALYCFGATCKKK